MLHQDSDDNVDEDKLGHQDKNNKENWRNNVGYAAIADTVRRIITVVPQSVLHDAIPVIASRHAK